MRLLCLFTSRGAQSDGVPWTLPLFSGANDFVSTGEMDSNGRTIGLGLELYPPITLRRQPATT